MSGVKAATKKNRANGHRPDGHRPDDKPLEVSIRTYDWPKSFRKQVIALTLQKGWLSRFPGVIQKEYFEILDERELVGMILAHHSKYQTAPLIGDLQKEFPEMQDDITDFFLLSNQNLSKTSHEVIEWAKDQAMMLALVDSIQLYKQNRHKEIRPRIVQAQQVGNDVVKVGYDLTIDTEEWRNSVSLLDVVGTPWRALNGTCGGGLGPGELGVILGKAGGLKTTSLINIGYWAAGLIYGYNVLHFSLEMSEKKILDRYAARVMLSDYKKYRSDTMNSQFKKALRKAAKEKLRGRIRVKQFPANQVTVEGLQDYTSMVAELKGFIPDMIIVDYPALISPKKRSSEARRFEYQEIYNDLRAWAIDWDIPMWVVAQAKTVSYGKYILGKSDIAEDSQIGHIADLLISVNQTKDEEEAGKVRYYVAKTREDTTGGHTRATVKYPAIIEPVLESPFVSDEATELVEKVKVELAKQQKAKKK